MVLEWKSRDFWFKFGLLTTENTKRVEKMDVRKCMKFCIYSKISQTNFTIPPIVDGLHYSPMHI